MPRQRRQHVWPKCSQQLCCKNIRKYEQVDTNRVATNQKHLYINQHHDLQHILAKYGKLFDRSLCVYPHQKVHIDLLPGLELVHHCAYPVPRAHEQKSKKELQHMVDIGILVECSASEWALPYFIVAKKMTKSDQFLISALSTDVS